MSDIYGEGKRVERSFKVTLPTSSPTGYGFTIYTAKEGDGMTEFKKGDRVRLSIPKGYDGYFSEDGETGTVLEKTSSTTLKIKRDVHASVVGYWTPAHCTLIENQKEVKVGFKRGDRVRIAKGSNYVSRTFEGEVGTVSDDSSPHFLTIDSAPDRIVLCQARGLELVKETPHELQTIEDKFFVQEYEVATPAAANYNKLQGVNTMSATKYYRVVKDHPAFETNAIISNETDYSRYAAIDSIFVKEFKDVNTFGYYEISSLVENQSEWFERVYPISDLKKKLFGTRKQAQAAAAVLFEDKK